MTVIYGPIMALLRLRALESNYVGFSKPHGVYLDVFEMLVEEEPVADADFPESLGPANLGPDASSIFPLLGQPHPVVPVRSRP